MPVAQPLGRLFDIASAFVPVDTQTATNTGDYISLKNAAGVLVVLFKAAGTANDDPVLSFYQATSVAGGSAKTLATITKHWQKQGTLTAVTGWTKVTQTAGATLTLNATSAENQGIYAVPITAEELDIANGFDCLRVDVADTGSAGAQLGAMLYILYGLAYPSAPESLPDPLDN